LHAVAAVDDRRAALLGAVHHPPDRFAGIVSPLAHDRGAAAVAIFGDDLRNNRFDTGLVGLVEVDTPGIVALRKRERRLLDHRDLGSVLSRRQCRGHARRAGADHHHVEGQRFLDVLVGDRMRLRQEGKRRAPVRTLAVNRAVRCRGGGGAPIRPRQREAHRTCDRSGQQATA